MMTTEQFLLRSDENVAACVRGASTVDEFIKHECPVCRDYWSVLGYEAQYGQFVTWLKIGELEYELTQID